jgi:hypothetical protein
MRLSLPRPRPPDGLGRGTPNGGESLTWKAFSRVTPREELPPDQPLSLVARGHSRPKGSQISRHTLQRLGSRDRVLNLEEKTA